ncbi:MAG TPA: DNA cytosine methyltransferase, partial [Thalassobaculum sp.]
TGGRGSYARTVDEPRGTAVTKQNQALVEPVHAALHDAAAADPGLRLAIEQGRVFLVDGQPYVFDILFRMLEPPELARGMGFRDNYRFVGNKTEVTRQIGNAVERHTAKALVRALFADEAPARRPAMASAEAAE